MVSHLYRNYRVNDTAMDDYKLKVPSKSENLRTTIY